uniref:Uncharacterized protein n=1 Tax=Ditylenchus dipsaci TaxID=166011 RepID=A0A915CQ59_9BILA
MTTAASTSSHSNLVFICENNEQIAIPETFPKFSRFLREYLNTFMVDNADEKSRQAASSIQLTQIEKQHVKVIFDFVEQWKRKMPSEYNDVLLDEEHIKR